MKDSISVYRKLPSDPHTRKAHALTLVNKPGLTSCDAYFMFTTLPSSKSFGEGSVVTFDEAIKRTYYRVPIVNQCGKKRIQLNKMQFHLGFN